MFTFCPRAVAPAEEEIIIAAETMAQKKPGRRISAGYFGDPVFLLKHKSRSSRQEMPLMGISTVCGIMFTILSRQRRVSMFQKMIKPVSFFLIFSLFLLDFSVQTAKAQMIGTTTVIAAQKQEAVRERVTAFLGRDDVRQAMVQRGVDVAEAQKRVASLSDSELTKISQAMEQLPAGGDAGLGAIVGAAVFIFVVLLITDLLGLTHIFSFVNHRH